MVQKLERANLRGDVEEVEQLSLILEREEEREVDLRIELRP
jgi:hypothetical protein